MERKKLWLYTIIVAFVLGAMFISHMIVISTCTNCGLITGFICIFGFLPALLIGFVIFFFLLKTKFARFFNMRNIVIFSIILAVVIVIPAIFYSYNTLPPKEITNNWECNVENEIYDKITGISIHYDKTYGTKSGIFLVVDGYVMENNSFFWEYDELSKEIIIKERDMNYINKLKHDGWTLTLKLDIKLVENSHYEMTTYYVTDTNFSLFNATLFEGATWIGSLLWDFQGR